MFTNWMADKGIPWEDAAYVGSRTPREFWDDQDNGWLMVRWASFCGQKDACAEVAYAALERALRGLRGQNLKCRRIRDKIPRIHDHSTLCCARADVLRIQYESKEWNYHAEKLIEAMNSGCAYQFSLACRRVAICFEERRPSFGPLEDRAQARHIHRLIPSCPEPLR
jgi:hypothetical protein